MITDLGPVVPVTESDLPLGTAFLADIGRGVDLAQHGYLEEERFISGTAGEWGYADSGAAVPKAAEVPFTTRMIIRRPANPADASGLVLLEPLHPNADTALTWQSVYAWALRNGHIWVGVTQDAVIAGMLRDRLGERYGSISLPVAGLGYDILGDTAVALRTGALPGVSAERVILSGWSATGSFCRVYLQDGFHDRHRLPDGGPAVDGFAICISSGAAGQAGYPPLSATCPSLPDGDPRRIVHGHGTPVFEILSELESETNFAALRDDSDAPDDRYRLYQIAGTSHVNHRDDILTNGEQLRRIGVELPDQKINEPASDARMDLVARALFDDLDHWIAQDVLPPTADRFTFTGEPAAPGEAVELARDSHGNVTGGIRTPWVEVPLARYAPHSTPAPGEFRTPPWGGPLGTPELVTHLIGNRTPFGEETVRELYASREDFLDRYAAAARACVTDRFLLLEDADGLIAHAATTWPG